MAIVNHMMGVYHTWNLTVNLISVWFSDQKSNVIQTIYFFKSGKVMWFGYFTEQFESFIGKA